MAMRLSAALFGWTISGVWLEEDLLLADHAFGSLLAILPSESSLVGELSYTCSRDLTTASIEWPCPRDQTIDRRRIPVGFFGRASSLFLLMKIGIGTSVLSRWLVGKFPKRHREPVAGLVELPTTASHVALVLACGGWGVVEKGWVAVVGR